MANTRFNVENGSLREILKASVDQKLKMVVYNTRTKSTREVEIIPTTSWGGNGLLGVSIKHSSFDKADERVWHVVEVENGSPAQQAGFKANEDYVIGSDSILQESDDLYNLIEAHEGKDLKLFVYNVNTDNCREVICKPNSKWGGKGYLGCEFAHGLLHRIPYGDGDTDVADNPRASLLRNEQPVATNKINTTQLQQQQIQQQTSAYTNDNMYRIANQLGPNQSNQQRMNQQPGQQLLQQALFDQKPKQQQETLLGPPKTFAQLASAQYQVEQNQQAHNQNQQQQFHMQPYQSTTQPFQHQQHNHYQNLNQQPLQSQQGPPAQPASQQHELLLNQGAPPAPSEVRQQNTQQAPAPSPQNYNLLVNPQYQSEPYHQQKPSQYPMPPYQTNVQYQTNPESSQQSPQQHQQQQQMVQLPQPQTFAQLASGQYHASEHYSPDQPPIQPLNKPPQQQQHQAPYQQLPLYQQPVFNQSNIQEQQQIQQIDPALSPNA